MKPHPTLPFIRLVRWFDYEPDLAERTDHVIGPDTWLAFYPDGSTPCPGSWDSEQLAIEGAAQDLFEEHLDMVAEHIEKAKEAGDLDLLIRLVDGRARAQTRTECKKKFSTVVIAAEEALQRAGTALRPFRHLR